jgi:exosome complex component RRP42
LLGRLYASDATLPMRQALCLIPGEKVWALHVDVVVLDSGGSVVDAASVAVRAALRTALLPRVIVIPGEADDDAEVEIDEGVLGGVEACEAAPVAVSLAVLGRVAVADATSDEAACAGAALTIGVGAKGTACGTVSRGGFEGFSLDVLQPLLRDAAAVGADIIAAVDAFVDEALRKRAAGDATEPIGFFS